MATGFDEVQKLLKDNMDSVMKSADIFTKGMQTLAAEATDYSKKSAEESGKYFERLMGARSLDVAIDVQSNFLRKSYEDAVGQATRFGSLYADMAKELSKPYESMLTKFGK